MPALPSRRDGQDEAVAEMPDDAAVGAQIRELRKARGMTLAEVATAADISVGYLSQIERNQSRLPIGVLKRISGVLGIQMGWFFHADDGAEGGVVVRAKARRRFAFAGIGITEELLSPNLAGPLELLMSTIEPGADSGEYAHEGAEAGIVLSGSLDLWVDGRRFRLEEGDSFSFRSTQVHRCANPGTVPTRVVWAITPPHY